MTKEIFKSGMMLLTAAFPGQVFNMRVYWDLLSDIDDVDFDVSVKRVIAEVTEVFPSTNLIAIIRGNAIENRRNRKFKSKKIEDRRCDPPPPSWGELKKKLGIK